MLERAKWIKRADSLIPWSLLLRGDRVSCPCCAGRFRRLRTYGSRRNALCPGCRSLERHRALCVYLKQSATLFNDGLRILHLAPEPILERRLKALPRVSYLGADLNPGEGQVRADVTDLPFADASFDMILCSHVLEHVREDRRAMSELYRVLAPGGRAILQHPIDHTRAVTFEDPSVATPRARRRAYGQRDHVRIYGRDFRQRLEDAGFRVTVVRVDELADNETTVRHCLPPATAQLRGGDIHVGLKLPSR
jgi:SAM-dependent methyltransferase